MSSTDKKVRSGTILAAPLSIEGVGADRILPPEASIVGATLLIPMWVSPSEKEGSSDLLEIWVLEPGAADEIGFYSNAFPVPVTPPPPITLPAQYLQRDGEIRLIYRVTRGDDGNPDTSLPQVFIVNRPPPVNLKEPRFPSATLWGYLNCDSQPKVWERLLVRVPAQPGRFMRDDECALDWEGFYNLNGTDPIVGTALRLTKLLTQEEASSDLGFDFILESDKYEQYIKPMERNASALASYTLYRNGIAQGKSAPGLVKIDRIIPGQSLSCGPLGRTALQASTEDALAFSGSKSRDISTPEVWSLPSSGHPSDYNIGDSMKNSSMESTKMNVQVKSGGSMLGVPPVVVNQLPDGRLTYKQLREDRSIKVHLTSITDQSPDGGAAVELHLSPKDVDIVAGDPAYIIETKYKDQQPGGVWTFPIEFDVDVSGLNDVFDPAGEYNLYNFTFVDYDVNGNIDTSDTPTAVLVDLTAPYQRQPGTGNGTGARPTILTLGGTFPEVIDDTWLSDPANAGGLNLTIPTAYQKFEADKDKVNFYISTQLSFSLMQAETPAYSGPVPASGVINIPLAFLRGLSDGRYYYSYNLTDLPGNISNNAAITSLFRRVKTPAPVLHDPRIPVTDGGKSINFTMVTEPPDTRVILEVDYPDNALANDRIIPYLYSSEATTVDLPEQSIPGPGPGTLKFELDYPLLAAMFGDPNKQDETELEYWYELERATLTPNPVSSRRFTLIDFAYAGPEQPNLPDPVNPAIVPVVVQGAGPTPPPPNTLGPDQAGMAAIMEWPLWNEVDRPVTGREMVTFYYQGKQVGEPEPVRVGATKVTTELPWDTIFKEGNGTVAGGDAREAYITVEYPGSENVMKQEITTKVDVTAIVIDLPAPIVIVSAFTSSSGSLVPERTIPPSPPGILPPTINCPSLNHPAVANGPMPPYRPRALRVRIRRDVNIPTGATVTLEFEGRTTNTPSGTSIPGTQITDSAPMPATGDLEFWLTDYAKIREIQLPPNGTQRPAARYARIAYTVNGIESEFTFPVALLNSSLVYCEQERPETP
ncbi:hypothetical protein [Pseudomonas sp. NFACC45]|uniref:hypothetical protein n=1 Tax=Pseudomonas sp. NFACC45 TaxID=1566201 RepID=UPI0008F2CB91|nr:hypothetical protein [Pseudomonas sp. NFACC45]SFG96384.1 hypothetical protein SAMN03159297_02277 [Pseudomonas sp. NFACC45]